MLLTANRRMFVRAVLAIWIAVADPRVQDAAPVRFTLELQIGACQIATGNAIKRESEFCSIRYEGWETHNCYIDKNVAKTICSKMQGVLFLFRSVAAVVIAVANSRREDADAIVALECSRTANSFRTFGRLV